MLSDLKPLVVVLFIAAAVFAVAGRACKDFIDPVDFKRRRNVWFALTVLGFVLPSMWLFAAVAIPLVFLVAKRDSNPLALYVTLMFVVPNAGVPIPTIGIGQLFDVSLLRILSLTILVPAVWRRQGMAARPVQTTSLDWLLIAYCLLQIALFTPYESPTNTLRRAFLTFIDTFIVFYAFSRLASTRRSLGDIAASLAIVGALLGSLAVFESVRGWLLYEGIPGKWGVSNAGAWLQRGESLRAQVTTGHALALGYTMSFCIGFWIYVQSQRPRSTRDLGITLVLCAGLIVTYSRGAWLMCILLGVVYMALRPGAGRVFVRVLPAVAAVGVVLYLSPLKESVIDRLPLIGTADQDTIEYRQQLAEVSWRLIKLNPFFGDPFVTNSMEELRQGQGIIDLINGYIAVTLFSGFVGLALFASFFVAAVWRCYVAMRAWRKESEQATLLGAVLVACMVASLFFIATAGVGSIEYLLAGLMASYASLAVPRAQEDKSAARVAPRFGGVRAPTSPLSS